MSISSVWYIPYVNNILLRIFIRRRDMDLIRGVREHLNWEEDNICRSQKCRVILLPTTALHYLIMISDFSLCRSSLRHQSGIDLNNVPGSHRCTTTPWHGFVGYCNPSERTCPPPSSNRGTSRKYIDNLAFCVECDVVVVV